MNKKILLSLTGLFILLLPLASADLLSSPIDLTIPFLALALVGGLIIGAVFLIRHIIKKIKRVGSLDSSVDTSSSDSKEESTTLDVPLGEEDVDVTYEDVKIDTEKGNI